MAKAKPPTHTPYLQVIPQRGSMDCAVACLAMLLGVGYEASLVAFKKTTFTRGAFYGDIQSAALALGFSLTLRKKFNLEEDTGLLGVRSKKWKNDHLVLLKEGLIVDTDATLWEVDVFLAAYEAKALSLLVVG